MFKLVNTTERVLHNSSEDIITLRPFQPEYLKTYTSHHGLFAIRLTQKVSPGSYEFDVLSCTLALKSCFRINTQPVLFYDLLPEDMVEIRQEWTRLKLPLPLMVSTLAPTVLKGSLETVQHKLKTFLLDEHPDQYKFVILDDTSALSEFGNVEQLVFSPEEWPLISRYHQQVRENATLRSQLQRQRELISIYEDSLKAIKQENLKEIDWYKSEREKALNETDKIKKWAKEEIERNYKHIHEEAHRSIENHASEVNKIQQWAEESIGKKAEELATLKAWADQEIEKITAWANEVNENARLEIEKITAWANEVNTNAQEEIENIKTWATEEVDRVRKWADDKINAKETGKK